MTLIDLRPASTGRFVSPAERAQRNKDAALIHIDHYGLPYKSITGLPSAAHVEVDSLDDLELWSQKTGARIVEADRVHDEIRWELHTRTKHPKPERRVRIHVFTTALVEPTHTYIYGVAA